MCGPDLWVVDTMASPLGIPGWRKEAGPRAGALSPSLPCQGLTVCSWQVPAPLRDSISTSVKWRRPWTRLSAMFLSAFVT